MTGRLVCIAIPYKDFKDKIRITKEYRGYRIEICKGYVLVSRR